MRGNRDVELIKPIPVQNKWTQKPKKFADYKPKEEVKKPESDDTSEEEVKSRWTAEEKKRFEDALKEEERKKQEAIRLYRQLCEQPIVEDDVVTEQKQIKPVFEDVPKHDREFDDEIMSNESVLSRDPETIWCMFKSVRDVGFLDKKYHSILGFKDGKKVGFTTNFLIKQKVKALGRDVFQLPIKSYHTPRIKLKDFSFLFSKVNNLELPVISNKFINRLLAVSKWYNSTTKLIYKVDVEKVYEDKGISEIKMNVEKLGIQNLKPCILGGYFNKVDYCKKNLDKLSAARYYQNKAAKNILDKLTKPDVKPVSKRVMHRYKHWLGGELKYGATINKKNFWLDYCYYDNDYFTILPPFAFDLIKCTTLEKDIQLIKQVKNGFNGLTQHFKSLEIGDASVYNLHNHDEIQGLISNLESIEFVTGRVSNIRILVIKHLPRVIQYSEASLHIGDNLSLIIPAYIKELKHVKNTNPNWLFKKMNYLGKLVMTDKDHAEWVLYDYTEKKEQIGLVNVVIKNKVVNMLGLPCYGGVARYINIDYAQKFLNPQITKRMYRHLLGDFTMFNFLDESLLELFKANMKTVTRLFRITKLEETLGKYKLTQIPKFFREDQIFIKDDILTQLESEFSVSPLYSVINFGLSVNKLLIFGTIIFMLSNAPVYTIIIKLCGLLDAQDDDEFIRIGKSISDKAKSLHNVIEFDCRPLFEIHNIVNRTETPIDWEQEKKNRVEPDVTMIPADYIYKNAKHIFMNSRQLQYEQVKYNRQTWKQFWKNRLEWATAGAFSSKYEEDKKIIGQFDKDFQNKLFYFINLPNETSLDHFIKRKAELDSTVSIKYEWAKQRAIYGCDVTNYVLSQFVMQNCEDLLTRDMAIGKNSLPEVVKAKIAYVLDNKVPFCLDFQDFNSQHTLSAMRAVICAFLDTWADRMSFDQYKAAYWLLDSISNQFVTDTIGTRTAYKANGTLLSGWRLTSFVNTILNVVYFKYLQGKLQFRHNSIHSGDDILIGLVNMRQVQNVYKNCIKANIRLSPLKCFYGSVAEFLRVEHKSKQFGQYIARSIATLVAAKIESKPAFNIRDVIEALYNRASEIIRRGGNPKFIKNLLHIQISYWSKRFGITEFDYKLICTCNRMFGGISSYKLASKYVIKLIPDPKEVERYQMTMLPKIQPGVYQYATSCLKFLPNKVLEVTHVAKYIQDRINFSFARIPNELIIRELSLADFYKMRNLMAFQGTFKKEVKRITEYGKIRLIGQTLEMFKTIRRDTKIAQFLEHSEDPLMVLNVLIS